MPVCELFCTDTWSTISCWNAYRKASHLASRFACGSDQDGMSPIQCALSVLNENNRPEIPAWCPQPLRALIRNCVEKDPHARPTFAQILAALDALP
jgi:hypothetical protein